MHAWVGFVGVSSGYCVSYYWYLQVEGWRQEEASYIANRKIHSDKIKTWTYLDTALDGAMVDLTNMHQEDQNMRKKRRMTGITSERNMADSAVGHGMADPAAERKMADLADVNLVPKENEGVNDVVPPEVDDVAPSDLDVVKPNPPPPSARSLRDDQRSNRASDDWDCREVNEQRVEDRRGSTSA